MPKESHPQGIDPAYPQKNFVQASYDNHGDKEGYMEYMYPGFGMDNKSQPKSHGYGHSIGQRAGKLRLSGAKGAHRIGKRSK